MQEVPTTGAGMNATQPSISGSGDEDVQGEASNEDDESLNDEVSGLDEDEIRSRNKPSSVATISSLRFQPLYAFRFSIPLCRMWAMPMLRPTLQSDLAKLE